MRRLFDSPMKVGLVAVAVCVLLGTLVFSNDLPFLGGFQLKAEFETANSLRPGSPVRVAGVEVGKVKKISSRPGSKSAVVTMELKDQALPIHKDATAKIRPRIFLEGNFFVELKPGSPGAATFSNGQTIPITHTAAPVQLDQILTSLQSDQREDLQNVISGVADTLSNKPTRADDQDADPSARGKTAAESLNDSYLDMPDALKGGAQINDALLGEQGDLAKLIAGTARTTGALVKDEVALRQLVGNFNRTLSAFATKESDLRDSIGLLGPTLTNANNALTALDKALPSTSAFARESIPGLKELPATITASHPWIAQSRSLFSFPELRGLAAQLAPTGGYLGRLITEGKSTMKELNMTARCFEEVVLPTGEIVINDEFSTGAPNYRDFFYGLVGLAGEGQNFDGNGSYVRFSTGGGPYRLQAGKNGEKFGNTLGVPQGTRPAYPGKAPAVKNTVVCYKNPIPNLNGPEGAAGPSDAAR